MPIPSRGLFILIFLLHVQIGRSQTLPYDPTHLYSAEALKADLSFVHNKLEKVHPGLYRYFARPAADRFFDSLNKVITGPMTGQDFYRLLTLLNSRIRNGHTMFLPGDSAMAYLNRNSKLLPLSVCLKEGKLTILENCSADSSFHPGTEILSINGISGPSIITELLIRQVRDGYNLTYPVWILNHYFSVQYSFVFGEPGSFFLTLKDEAGKQYTKHLMALTKDSIRYFRYLRYGAGSTASTTGQGILLQQGKQKNTAVLAIKTFDADVLRSVYRQDYREVLDSVFTQINHDQIRNLIIDLRDNQGGDFTPGRTLLSYLVQHPSRFLLSGKEARIIQPGAKRFKGRLFVLINGGSFSITAIVCSCLKKERSVVFIGEETGGNPHIISGDPEEFVLPHTKIKAEISTTTYRISGGQNCGRGIMPDYAIHQTIAEILAGEDPAKALAIKLSYKAS